MKCVRIVIPRPDPIGHKRSAEYCREYLAKYDIQYSSIMYNGSLRDHKTKMFCTVVVDDETLLVMKLKGEKILPDVANQANDLSNG